MIEDGIEMSGDGMEIREYVEIVGVNIEITGDGMEMIKKC